LTIPLCGNQEIVERFKQDEPENRVHIPTRGNQGIVESWDIIPLDHWTARSVAIKG